MRSPPHLEAHLDLDALLAAARGERIEPSLTKHRAGAGIKLSFFLILVGLGPPIAE